MNPQDLNESNPGWRPTREEVNEFLRDQILCVLSTLDKAGAPQGATVAFSVAKSGELIIGTSETSHKARNVEYDERVAMTVTDAGERFTVQIQGIARKLTEAEFVSSYADEHYAQRPESLPFKDLPGQTHILVTPQVIRFSDCNPHPWVITEFIE